MLTGPRGEPAGRFSSRSSARGPRGVDDVDDEVGALDRDRVGFHAVRPLDHARGGRLGVGCDRLALFDADVVAADAEPFRIAPRLAGPHVELPAMMRTGQDLAAGLVLERAGRLGLQDPPELAGAQLGALVWAAIAQGEVFAAEIEDADRTHGDHDDLALAGRDLVNGRDDVLHGPSMSSGPSTSSGRAGETGEVGT